MYRVTSSAKSVHVQQKGQSLGGQRSFCSSTTGKAKTEPEVKVSLSDLKPKPTVSEAIVKHYAPFLLKFNDPKLRYRITAGTIVERPPVVAHYHEPWMIDYQTLEGHQKLEQLLLREFAAKKKTEEYYANQAALGKKTKSQAKKDTKAKEKEAKKTSPSEAAKQKKAAAEAKEEVLREDVWSLIDHPEIRLGLAPGLPPKEIRTLDNGYVPSPDQVYPLLTEADYNNDRKSLYRKLTNRLYLIVKKPRAEHSWGFPQGGYETADGNHLRQTAERELKEEIGDEMQVQFMGNSPFGVYQYFLPEKDKAKYSADATKACFLHGNIKLNPKELVDYQWVTRRELRQYLEPSFCEAVEKFLPGVHPYE